MLAVFRSVPFRRIIMTSTRGQNVQLVVSTCQLVVSSIVPSRSEFVVSFILSLVVSSSCRLSNSSRHFVLLIGFFHLRSFRRVVCLWNYEFARISKIAGAYSGENHYSIKDGRSKCGERYFARCTYAD